MVFRLESGLAGVRGPKWGAALLAISGVVSALGCSARTDIVSNDGDDDPYGSIRPELPPPLIETSDKVDLLLVIDDSPGMVDAQQVMVSTLPYLLSRLTDPQCVNGLGNVVGAPVDGVCEVGLLEFTPVRDLHIGVVSTSLGGLGADTCSPSSPSFDPAMDDGGRLLSRDASGGVVPTYDNLGFLWWDPGQQASPPGESDLLALQAKFLDIASGVGVSGCGFESQLETVYRFLVEPNPYESISVSGALAEPVGTDEILLAQRADFLRPDSAVVVLMLTEENDCSTRVGDSSFLMRVAASSNGTLFHLPRARSECAEDPDDPCCTSCGANPPPGCGPNDADPACQLPGLDPIEDPINLRCFDQKRRFGVDFLYPIERYVRGLSERTIPDRDNQLVDNPLFVGGRSPELVVFAGVVGVPWQDLAVDADDLSAGYLPHAQIDWSLMLDVDGEGPRDPLMIESIDPRTGTHPLTQSPLAPPSAPSPQQNPINGHEREIPLRDDLQYACIFRLPEPVDCEDADCLCGTDVAATDPLCQADDGSYGALRRFSGARPSTRILEVMKELGERAVPASICPVVASDPASPSFGYRPAVDALMRTLRRRLVAP